jgi:protein-S-isoprenylcysteine O-methyltransferase Ste14
MSLFEILSWISFLTLNLSIFLTFFFYILSVIPVTLEEKIGERSWKLCAIFRIISDILFLIIIVSILMWVWFPISILNWRISENYIFLIITAVLIAIPSFYILIRALKDAGETVEICKETQMYGGIYKYIRHPQISGSILMFLIFCLILNSLFYLIWIISLMILITPIVIYFEEKDLIKRFGVSYLFYRKNTGALIPKFRSKVKG